MIKTNPLSVKDISNIAASIKEQYGIAEDQRFTTFEILKQLFYDNYLSIQLLEDDDPYLDKNTPVVYNANDNFIYLKESVIEEVESDNYRSNFALAHEFFHYLQHQVLGFLFVEVGERKTYENLEL